MHKFFKAQLENPSKGDWISEVKQWIVEYDIAKSIQEVKTVKKSIYEKIIKDKIHEEAFQYLKGKIKSKGSQIDHGARLNMQDYLHFNILRTNLNFFIQI